MVLILAVFVPVIFFHFDNETVVEIDNRSDWEVYTNQEYGFSLEHPPEWRVVDLSDHELVPKFHLLSSEIEDIDSESLTHHSDIPNVSIFPQGYPTEGIFGEPRPSQVNFGDGIEEATDFLLSNGEVWATMLTLDSRPDGWNEYGFIWSRVSVDNFRTLCFEDGEEIDRDRCDPALGHEIRHRGQMNLLEQRVHREILRSFDILE